MHKVVYFFAKIYWFIFRPRTYGVKCAVLFENKILLVRNTYGKDWWNIPGGGIKKGELPHDAAKREILEEVGISLKEINSIGEFHTTYEYKRDRVSCFYSSAYSDQIKIDRREIKEAKWFSIGILPEDKSPTVDEVLALLKPNNK